MKSDEDEWRWQLRGYTLKIILDKSYMFNLEINPRGANMLVGL